MLTNEELATPAPLSLRAYARRRGTSAPSVVRAIKRGRLQKSLVYVDGKPQIGDPDLADQEWAQNTDLTKAPSAVKQQAAQRQVGVTPPPLSTVTEVGSTVPDGLSLADAAAEEKRWKARQAELDFRREAGELVNVEAVTAMYVEEAIRVRTKITAVPNKLKARAPELSHATVRILDDLLRQALEELAAEDTGKRRRGAA